MVFQLSTSMLDYLKEIFCNKPLLQFPDPNKPYILYVDASNNAYSSILCQPIDSDQDIRPVAYFSGTFTAQNRSWCATEEEAYAILNSVQHFELLPTSCKVYSPLQPQTIRTVSIQRNEDS